jgi:ABC-2 type transport system permease protein
MRAILVLLRKDFAILLQDRVSLLLTFVIPFVLIYIFGLVFHVNSSDPGPSGIPLAVVNQSDNPAATRLVDALRSEKAFKVVTKFVNGDKSRRPLEEGDLRPLMRADAFRFAVVVPKDVVSGHAFGIHLKIYSNPRNDIEAQLVTGILQKTLFTNVPELLGQSLQARAQSLVGSERLDRFNSEMASTIARAFGGNEAEIKARMADGQFGIERLGRAGAAQGSPAAGGSDALSSIFKIDAVQVAGNDVKSPAATLLVGGWAMQFLLFAVTASATGLFWEKQGGIFQRLLSGPVTRSDILWSKFLYGVCLGLIQLVVLFFAGELLYGIQVGAQIGHLVVVCVFAAAACTSFGMLVASISPTPEAARGIATFVILLMCAIGGAWFPVSFMPEFIQRFSRLTLVYWSMEGFSQVLWSHASFAELLPTLGWLTLMTAVVMSFSVWRFNKGKIFD